LWQDSDITNKIQTIRHEYENKVVQMTFKEPSMSSLNNWSIGSGCVSDEDENGLNEATGDIGNGLLNQRN
jgi:hypothetical protein